MSATTGIAWCDSTLNFWAGCTKVSPACDYCYAERDSARFRFAEWGTGKPRKQMAKATRSQADKWNKVQFYECSACGRRGAGLDQIGESTFCPNCGKHGTSSPARRRVFINPWSDWLDNEVPIEWLVDLLDRIRRCPNIDFLLLTKRIGNWRKRLEAVLDMPTHRAENGTLHSVSKSLAEWLTDWIEGIPPANVWLGATVIDQPEADRDVPKLVAVPARVRFLSIEPMLGAIDLNYTRLLIQAARSQLSRAINGEKWIDWIITGAESGPKARPSHPDWFRLLRDQCAAYGVAYLHKQNGEWIPFYDRDVDDPDWREVPKVDNQMGRGATRWLNLAGGLGFYGERLVAMRNVGREAAGRLLDGVGHNQFPAVSA